MYKRYLKTFKLGPQSRHYDVVVVGAGVAGLFASLTLDPGLKVLVIAKETLRDCNSDLAQGGIAITLDKDYDSHIEDTLKAGSYYNDPEVVAQMIKTSEPVFEDLMGLEAVFDRNEDGSIALTAEGGHRKRRIIHSKDLTGEAVMTALIQALSNRKNIEVSTQTRAIDLITDQGEMAGLLLERQLETATGWENQLEAVGCHQAILATGGIGGLFRETTNVAVNTGDGLAMAIRAGAAARDSEFIQFHPTAMALKAGGYFLISEAVRGEGGLLINDLGERFMLGQHEMNELAPRDVVAKAIHDQKLLGRGVYVDVRHFEGDRFKDRFPNIYKTCLANGIDPSLNPIPVTPVEHYYMGGISCDVDGRVLDATGGLAVKGLFATGEAAATGFHGANRLASNSLLECLVLSKRISEHLRRVLEPEVLSALRERCQNRRVAPIGQPLANQGEAADLEKLYQAFRDQFSASFTIVKNTSVLKAALEAFEGWLRELEGADFETPVYVALYNGLVVAREIALGSLAREASLGAFILERPE